MEARYQARAANRLGFHAGRHSDRVSVAATLEPVVRIFEESLERKGTTRTPRKRQETGPAAVLGADLKVRDGVRAVRPPVAHGSCAQRASRRHGDPAGAELPACPLARLEGVGERRAEDLRADHYLDRRSVSASRRVDCGRRRHGLDAAGQEAFAQLGFRNWTKIAGSHDPRGRFGVTELL